jgi:hypothetical protein
MKNPRDKQQILFLAKQIFPDKPKILTEAFQDATNQSYGYLIIDLTPTTSDDYRLRTRIFPEETNNIFSPIIYKPKL